MWWEFFAYIIWSVILGGWGRRRGIAYCLNLGIKGGPLMHRGTEVPQYQHYHFTIFKHRFRTIQPKLYNFPCGLVVRIRRFHRRGPGSIPGMGITFVLATRRESGSTLKSRPNNEGESRSFVSRNVDWVV